MFVKFVKNFLCQHFKFDAHSPLNGERFEILDFYTSALSADMNYLFQISNRNNEVSALYTQLHTDAYFATFNNIKNSQEGILKSLGSFSHFDFGALTWGEILELKQSEFLSDFRDKFSVWVYEFNQDQDITLLQNKVDNYIRDSLYNFMFKNKPKVGKDMVIGFLSNIPGPLINPVSMISAGMQVVHDVKMKRDFGWLMFIQEAVSAGKCM